MSMAVSGPGDQCCSERLPVHVAALVFSFLCPPFQGQNSWSEAVGVSVSIMGGHIARALMPYERTRMLFPFGLHQSAGCAVMLP